MSDKKENQDKKLSREPYKGTRDFYPEDMAFQKWLFSVMRKVCESYGYVEYGASPLEIAELYAAKTGEEIVNEQTYTFEDRGGRKVTLRPEMTPTIARMIAARRRELSFPLRWYSIPNLFRYEQPQRGRLREHYQLNIDIFGVKSIEADIEIISVAHSIMKALGAKDEDFEIRINSRKLLQERILPKLKNTDMYSKALRIYDKIEKIPLEEFEKEWQALSNEPAERNTKPNETITNLIDSLKKIGVSNAVFHPTLVRGFDYYTDIVFEIFDTNKENRRALFGGGRYDELLSIFDEESIPAVGFGMGDVATRDFLETHKIPFDFKSPVDLYICLTEDVSSDFANEIAAKLRKDGVNVAIDWSRRKIGDQIKSADKAKIPYIIVLGEEEMKSETFNLKNLATGEESKLSLSEIANKLK